MKRIVIAAVTVLFFFILLALIVLKLVLPHENSEPAPQTFPNPFEGANVIAQRIYTDSAYRVALSCYSWYVQAYLAGATYEQISTRPESRACFTPAFMSTWETAVQSTAEDPVILSQTALNSWGDSINAEIIGQSIRSQDIRVTLGEGSDQMSIVAHVMKENGEWRIDGVTKE